MNDYLYRISVALGGMLSCMPTLPGSEALVNVLNKTLRHDIPAKTLSLLEGRALQAQVADIGVRFDFAVSDGVFEALPEPGEVDLKMSATFEDFRSVIGGETPFDTLFYSRRIVLEGDLDIGFAVKEMFSDMDFGTTSLETVMQLWRTNMPRDLGV
ncbi:SCP2 sterol-binding domain-containing protein [Paraburkholderia sp. Ac-20347]|jgi:O2-independent ubiquinone biosynthesis accessory factor UbiT|uniref:ubiquinone anaerobic biosynthesis accessory factor UbiT n=1 Tax=Paraburkholderia sp. Ac-20347 TaxID=2703892 RepID=UPI00197FFF5E|nr:SCP2 sterol-binding domain-containing protein [Paraburkholderia sp. Ac-20347]MBN3809023.1 sterol-binding protein [Paraburkholderia sp. Ac-20347]MBN3812236.1 sterol-binding protein [Paraburkholderia sp. Ac-20347]